MPPDVKYHKVKASDLSQSFSDTFTFIDVHPACADRSTFGLGITKIGGVQDGWSSMPGEFHNRGANIAD